MKTLKLAKLLDEVNPQHKSYVGRKYVSRPGIHYAWFNAYQLDYAIHARQDFAVRWREEVIAAMRAANVTTCRVRSAKYGVSKTPPKMNSGMRANVVSINGSDVLFIAPQSQRVCKMTQNAAPQTKTPHDYYFHSVEA